MPNSLITNEEMVEITGYEQPAKQCKALDDHGIIYMKDREGRPRTTWFNFNHPRHLRNTSMMDEEPDFGAMRA